MQLKAVFKIYIIKFFLEKKKDNNITFQYENVLLHNT